MKSTKQITYVYDFQEHEIAITRIHIGTAYARNGNVGNATEYFKWTAKIDGKDNVGGYFESRTDAYEHARARILGIRYANNPIHHHYENVRNFNIVRDEMKANYERKETR